MDKRIGITTTIPVEVIFAAGLQPVDLNNLLISDREPGKYITRAELAGLPRNVCAWTKGIFETAITHGIKRVVAVAEGDCSNSRAIMERWRLEGIEVIPISYPYDRDRARMRREIERLAARFGVSWERVEAAWKRLKRIRRKVHELDDITWKSGVVRGEENHFWLVSCSDFRGDPSRFERDVSRFLANTRRRKRGRSGIRIGYAGVPPIIRGLYGEMEKIGFSVVYNEIQRQFSMPTDVDDIVSQYLSYTYPYDIAGRLADIKAEIKRRKLAAIIHYVQSFCHRGIEDYMVRREVGVPVLTLECDRPGPLGERNRIRLEAFFEMLSNS